MYVTAILLNFPFPSFWFRAFLSFASSQTKKKGKQLLTDENRALAFYY